MYTSVLSDFSRVILNPIDEGYASGLNALHKELLSRFNGSYSASEYFRFNTELLDFYASLKGMYHVNVFTTDIVQNHPDIKPVLERVFEHIFSANELGLNKKTREAYLDIAARLATPAERIIYLDDQPGNVAAATSAGLKALLYTGDTKASIKEIKGLLGVS